MLIQVNTLGSDSKEKCRAHVAIPAGSTGVKLISMNLPHNAGAFSSTFVDGISVGTGPPNENFTVPSFGAWSDLRQYLNNLKTASGDRVFYVFGAEEFDICTDQYQVVLSLDFAAYLGIDQGLLANTCYTAAFDMDHKDPVFEYVVRFIAPIDARDFIIGAVQKTRGDAYSNDFHDFKDVAEQGRLEVYCRLKNGEEFLASCEENDTWGVELEF